MVIITYFSHWSVIWVGLSRTWPTYLLYATAADVAHWAQRLCFPRWLDNMLVPAGSSWEFRWGDWPGASVLWVGLSVGLPGLPTSMAAELQDRCGSDRTCKFLNAWAWSLAQHHILHVPWAMLSQNLLSFKARRSSYVKELVAIFNLPW